MKRSLSSLTLVFALMLIPALRAEVEFIYTIKEKVFDQQGNTQPITPTEWSFGAGASGNDQLTAVSITLPGEITPTVIAGDDGEFDLDPDSFPSQAALDAAYANGNFSLSITDGGSSQDLGPFSLTGDAYPNTPHITNALELQASDYTQDFLLTWNTFSGADSDDRIIIQIWDDEANEEIVFEFLDATDTSYTIPGNTFSDDQYYDVDIIFVKETDGLVNPETIIGYLTTTSYCLSTHTSDTDFSFYKWQRVQQTASNQSQIDGYQMFASVNGDSRNVTYAEISNPNNIQTALNPSGDNSHLLFTQYDSKAELDNAFPPGEYRFFAIEDNVNTDYSCYFYPADAYPTAPLFQNFTELLNFDATQEKTINWTAAPAGINLVQLRILNGSNEQVWSAVQTLEATSVALPANTLDQDEDYTLVLRHWAPAITNEKPPSSLGYVTSTFMDFQTSEDGGGDPGIQLAYTIKERVFQQEGNTQPTIPIEWSFVAGIEGGSNVTGGSVDYPGGNEVLDGSPGEYESEEHDFASQAALDTAFPNGSFTLNATVDASNQVLGSFTLSGDTYPDAPHITNADEFRAADHSQSFLLSWDAFSGADSDDLLILEIDNNGFGDDPLNEFLDPTATSFEIPANSLTEGNLYEVNLLFIKTTDGLETPQTVIGYMSRTTTQVSTITSDTSLRFYKTLVNLQTDPDTLQLEGYRPFVFVRGNNNAVTYAEINSNASSNALDSNVQNVHFLIPPLDTQIALDAAYPPGEYNFWLNEEGEFLNYGPYLLPPDAYPLPPQFDNFPQLQSFDVTQQLPIQWELPPQGVTLVALQIRDPLDNSIVWQEQPDPDATSVILPPDTLDPFYIYDLSLRFWSEQTGSDFPDASLGYLSLTHMPIETFSSAADFATFQQQFFSGLDLLDLDIVGQDADPDGDKLSNYFEFLAKLDPTDGASKITYAYSFDPDEILEISPILPGVVWEVQSSPDLLAWDTVPPEKYSVMGNKIQIDLSTFLPNTFFQVVVSDIIP